MTPLKFFSPDEYRAADQARRMALVAYDAENPIPSGSDGWTPARVGLSRSFFPPGSVWLCHWYFDPADEVDAPKRAFALARPESDYAHTSPNKPFLNLHYWRDWSHVRPPLCLVLPSYGHWIPDQGSSNGMGWTVTGWRPGDVSELVANPSIDAPGYHGWLGCNGAPPGHLGDPL